MKLLGISSPKSSAVSLDLLNLYVVNQISNKKDNTGKFKCNSVLTSQLTESVILKYYRYILILVLPLIT